jgi:hypothetical protein
VHTQRRLVVPRSSTADRDCKIDDFRGRRHRVWGILGKGRGADGTSTERPAVSQQMVQSASIHGVDTLTLRLHVFQGPVVAWPRRAFSLRLEHNGHIYLYAQVSFFIFTSRETAIYLPNVNVRVTSLSVLDETEITWSKFPDPGWNRWSAYQLQRKWRSLKRSIPGHENMTPQGE